MRGRRATARTDAQEGDLIEVYWPGDKRYYAGKIARFDPVAKLFRVEYVDGDIENLDLTIEKWRHAGPNYVETSSVPSGEDDDEDDDEEVDEDEEEEEEEEDEQEENDADSTAERGKEDNMDIDDADEEKVNKSHVNDKKDSSSRSSLPSRLEKKSEHSPSARKILPRADTVKHNRQPARSLTPQRRQNGTANRAPTSPPASKLASIGNAVAKVSGPVFTVVNHPGAVSSTVPFEQTAATRHNSSANKDGASEPASPTRSANRAVSATTNKQVGPARARTSSASGEVGKGKKIGKQTTVTLKGGKRQSKFTVIPRRSVAQSTTGKKTAGTVANGHSAQHASNSPSLGTRAASAQHHGATKRGRAHAESPDSGKGKRPRRDAGEETGARIVDNVAHVDMMKLLSLEASKQSIGMAVGPLQAKVQDCGKEHDMLKEQQGNMKKCLEDVHTQLAKIEETCNAQKINEIVRKSIQVSVAELRTYIKSTIDESERQRKQANAALRMRVAEIESETQKIATDVSKMPTLVADKVVVNMDIERANSRAELKKIVEDAKGLFDNSRNEVVEEMKSYIDQTANKAVAKATNIISATLPNVVSAQLATQMEAIITGMLAKHQVVAPMVGQPQALGGNTVLPTPTSPVGTAPTSAPPAPGLVVPPSAPQPTSQRMVSPTTLSQPPSQPAGNLSAGGDMAPPLKTEQTWLAEKTAFAKALVGRSATIWLLEDTDRSAPPAQQNLRRTWAKECCTLCFRHVSSSLSKFSDPAEAMRVLNASLCVDDMDLSWFLEPINAASIEKARLNYSTWDPPLCNDEWHAEASVLKELSQRFGVAQGRISPKASDSALQIAIAITHAAASGEE